MTDPLTLRRLAGVVGGFDLLSMPFSSLVPLPEDKPTGMLRGQAARSAGNGACLGLLQVLKRKSSSPPLPRADPAALGHMHCSAVLLTLQLLVGIALPLFFLARTEWREPPAIPPLEVDSAQAASSSWWQRARRRIAWAAAWANWLVWRFSALPSRTATLPLCWLLVSLTWSLSLLVYGI